VRGFNSMQLPSDALAGLRVTVVSAGCDVLADEAEAFCALHPEVRPVCCPDLPHDFCLHAGKLASTRAGLERILATLT
jgi:acetyl esterase